MKWEKFVVKMYKFLISRRLWYSPACFLWEFDDKYDMIKSKYRIRSNKDGG